MGIIRRVFFSYGILKKEEDWVGELGGGEAGGAGAVRMGVLLVCGVHKRL